MPTKFAGVPLPHPPRRAEFVTDDGNVLYDVDETGNELPWQEQPERRYYNIDHLGIALARYYSRPGDRLHTGKRSQGASSKRVPNASTNKEDASSSANQMRVNPGLKEAVTIGTLGTSELSGELAAEVRMDADSPVPNPNARRATGDRVPQPNFAAETPAPPRAGAPSFDADALLRARGELKPNEPVPEARPKSRSDAERMLDNPVARRMEEVQRNSPEAIRAAEENERVGDVTTWDTRTRPYAEAYTEL